EIRIDKNNFDSDLKWGDALSMFERLGDKAARAGVSLGAKFTNTLVVKNHKQFFSDELMYLSGEPLHVLATVLAARFTLATGGRCGLSFSGGVDAQNFPESVACGMVPITTCTDLLRPQGYGRLRKYLGNLEALMDKLGAQTIDQYILARANQSTAGDAQ